MQAHCRKSATCAEPFVGQPSCGQAGEYAVEGACICSEPLRRGLFLLSFFDPSLVH
jgi:hypothetical protein